VGGEREGAGSEPTGRGSPGPGQLRAGSYDPLQTRTARKMQKYPSGNWICMSTIYIYLVTFNFQDDFRAQNIWWQFFSNATKKLTQRKHIGTNTFNTNFATRFLKLPLEMKMLFRALDFQFLMLYRNWYL
jgi:hypothetical protein